jgi:hypothetical protein
MLGFLQNDTMGIGILTHYPETHNIHHPSSIIHHSSFITPPLALIEMVTPQLAWESRWVGAWETLRLRSGRQPRRALARGIGMESRKKLPQKKLESSRVRGLVRNRELYS